MTGNDAGTGSLLAALAEAAFLIGLEKNRYRRPFCVLISVRSFHVSNSMRPVEFQIACNGVIFGILLLLTMHY